MKKGKSITIKVRGYHLDIYQHVNNARYLEFLEEARWEVFDTTFRSGFLKERALAFTVININISYRTAALVHDELRIETYLQKLSSRSVTVLQKIFNSDTEKLVAKAEVVFVLVDKAKNRAVKLEEEFLKQLNQCFEH